MPPEAESASQIVEGGVAKVPTPAKDRRDPKLIEREKLLAQMDARIVEKRLAEDEEWLQNADIDPQAFAKARAMKLESAGKAIPTDRQGGERDAYQTDASEDPTPVEAMDEVDSTPAAPERVEREAVRISNKGEDPLGKYVVRTKDGKPMFKTLVDGQERLIPLERAHAELQKLNAGDERLRQAAERRKELEARETALRQNEEAFKRRQHPRATPAPVIDDRKLAAELVRSLVSEPEDKAAERMAETFKAIRQASAPAVDLEAIEARAADRAVRTIAEQSHKEALLTGFDQFKQNYPEIASDSDLFKLADSKSELIAEQHPDWKPQQVMDEAGRQTRAWLKSIGAPVREQPKVPSSNQQRKQNLVPMPQARSVRPAAPTPEREQTPAEIVAEIRKQRMGY